MLEYLTSMSTVELKLAVMCKTMKKIIQKIRMQSRTLGTNILGPDNSASGGYYFMNLNTGK